MFLALATTAVWIDDRGQRAAASVAGAAGLSVLALSVAFPEGGTQPYSVGALISVSVASLIVWICAGDGERTIRVGAMLYAGAAMLAFLLPTPMGSNVTRLGAGFAAPLLLGMLMARPRSERVAPLLVAAALVFLGVWQAMAPVREVSRGIGDPSYQARYYAPLLAFIDRDTGGLPVRVEVPFTRSHWESVYVAPRFALARGWETQLDTKYNDLFFGNRITAASYRRWLVHNAVGLVAVADAPLDPSGQAEARLIGRGLPYLDPVWSNRHWRVYRVRDAQPLVSGPAELVELASQRFVLRSHGSGSALVRVRWTPYWVVEGGGCVARAGEWTRVQLPASGQVAVRARFAATRLVERERNCSLGPREQASA
jgi:hypothetical protein